MQIQADLIAAIVSFSLGVAIFLRSPQNRLFQKFTLLCGSVGLIHISIAIHSLTEHLFWQRMKILGIAICIPSLIHFFSVFPDPPKQKKHREFLLWLTLSVLVMGTTVLPQSIIGNLNDFFAFPIYNTLIEFLFFLAMLKTLQQMTTQYKQTVNPIRRARLKILLIGGALTLFGIMLQQITSIPPLGSITGVIFLYFLYQVLIHYRLLDLQEILGRGTVLTIEALFLTVLLWGLFRLAALGFPDPQIFSLFEIQHFIFSVFISVIILILFHDPLRKLLEIIVKRILFRHRFIFEHQIQTMREELPSKVSQGKATDFILNHLHRTERVSNASVYIMDEEFQALRLKGEFGGQTKIPQTLSHLDFIQHLKENRKPLLLEKLQRQIDEEKGPDQEKLQTFIENLYSLDSQLTLPMVTGLGELKGILNLKDRGFDEAYSNSEIRLLMTLTGQFATVIKSIQLYNQIIEKDRLIELGEMAAGLAHEIRNPLGAIKGAAQFLDSGEEEEDSPDSKFLRIIVQEADRLNRVLEEFLDFARSEKEQYPDSDLNLLLERTIKIIRTNGLPKKIKIHLDMEKKLPKIPMNSARMKQVFLNLAINAIQAMPEGGVLNISSELTEPTQVEVNFSDTGPGIMENDPHKIFAPFYTTKEKGSGLGLSICKRIISDHGGKIEGIRLGPDGGACFRIQLPTEQSLSDQGDDDAHL